MENWLDKYQPHKLSDVLGDKSYIQQIEQFTKMFTRKKINRDKIYTPNIIITGTNGIGKTLIVDLVLNECGLQKITADLSNISVARKTKRNKKVVEQGGLNRTIQTYYRSLQDHKVLQTNGEYVTNKIALVFDDVSNISNPKEKEAIKSLVKLNNKLKQFPIFIISNTKHSKTMNELKKMVTYQLKKVNSEGKRETKKITNEVVLRTPNYNDIENFVKNICSKEKLNIVKNDSDDDDIYVEIINHAQSDIRRLINILEELKLIYGNNQITLKQFEQYREISKTKDIDPGIHEATRMLLNKYTNIDDALILYGEERATIPLMVHENYPLNIKQQYPKMSILDQMDIISNISKCISESDKVDGIIYSKQCWSLQPVHGFYSCVMPSYYINKHPGKLFKMEKYRYTQDYNKTSIKKINNKVIKQAQEHKFLKKASIHDFLYFASILKTLYERGNFKRVAQLMKPYQLTDKEIDSIIKIDKINKSKNQLTGKQRNHLKQLLEIVEV
jgi:hypothetical protein